MRITFVLVLAAGLASGCAATAPKQISGGTNVVQPLPADLSGYGSLGFRVTSGVGATQEAMADISRRVVESIRSGGEFGRVVDLTSAPEESVELELQFDITGFNDVTSQDRFWKGAMAGSAQIVGSLVLQQVSSKDVLGAAVVTAYTGSANTRAGTTEDAIERAAQEIATFMSR